MIILIDNGSKRPAATKNLRRLAAEMSGRVGETVHPVSLLHSSDIAPNELDGEPARTLEQFLNQQAEQGERDFFIVPLFFGPSRAIDLFLPNILKSIDVRHGALNARVAPVLCPLPEGEPRLVDILEANARDAIEQHNLRPSQIMLVDHGSPMPAVTAVRHWLAAGLAQRFAGELRVTEAVMERRPDRQYDFNGTLLEEALEAAAPKTKPTTGEFWTGKLSNEETPVGNNQQGKQGERAPADIVLAMQFVSPGRHAGPGGDIGDIVNSVANRQPGLRIVASRLISDHPLFSDILQDRIAIVT